MITGVIYMFENKMNNKKYIGKTLRIKERYNEHKRANDNSLFHSAIKEFGFDNFVFSILEEVTLETKKSVNSKLNEIEKYYIALYKTRDKEYGYNVSCGGDGSSGCLRSDETKQKISISKIGERNPMKRKEIRDKVSKSLIGRNGRKHTNETKQKISISKIGERNPMYGKTGDLNPSFGIDWTKNISKEKYEEFCEKRSKCTLGNKNPMYGRKQNKSLWSLPDGSTKIMANCSVAAKHKDWIKISDYECVVQK